MTLKFSLFLLLISASATSLLALDSEIVCGENEFLCKKEGRCVANSKVCNFIKDCQDGSDESKCGACSFDDADDDCGLVLKSDRYYGWIRSSIDDSFTRLFSSSAPTSYLKSHVKVSAQKYNLLSGHGWWTIYKPMILFPKLQSTDNTRCRFTLAIRVSENLDHVITRQSDISLVSWPQVFMLISQSGGQKEAGLAASSSQNLDVSHVSAGHRGAWFNYSVLVGARAASWSLELVASVHLQSYQIHLSRFGYENCEPSDEWQAREAEEALAAPEPCQPNEFRCRISGRCISQSLVCDFGYDCGPTDPSDEDECDLYPGRCDFESGHLCDWIPRPEDGAWLLASAEEEDQSVYGKLPRPQRDHTYRSPLVGHYLLLNSSQLRVSARYSLIGPQVSLVPWLTAEGEQEEAKQRQSGRACSFRFWYQVPGSLASASISSPRLSVGYEQLNAERLFGEPNRAEAPGADEKAERDELLPGGFQNWNDHWRRGQVELLNGYNLDERPLDALEISFGNFDKDLEKYLELGGYLALDDFSFSPDCGLLFHGPPGNESCPDSEFMCPLGAPKTGTRCIGSENYCDFKNDCSLPKPTDWLAADETDCPHECHFRADDHCNYQIMDARHKKQLDELKQELQVIEAFSWQVERPPEAPAGFLAVQSASRAYLEARAKTLAEPNSNAAPAVELESLEIRLPVFSGAHANCSLELEYSWQTEEPKWSMFAELRLVHEASGLRHLLKSMRADGSRAGERRSLRVGVGPQSQAFRAVLVVRHDAEEPEQLEPFEGAFQLHAYRFRDCSFFAGLLYNRHEVRFVEEAPGAVPAASGGDLLDYLDSAELYGERCAADHFQCRQPVVCIPRHLVCDMQRDCQGGRDESNCSAYQRYDMGVGQQLLPAGWLLGDRELVAPDGAWRVERGVAITRRLYDAGPAFDHTAGDHLSNYLMAGGAHGNSGRPAELYSPLFKAPGGQGSCRLVFHLYAHGSHIRRFRVLRRGYPSARGQLLFELPDSAADRKDAWQRLAFELSPLARDGGDAEFSVVFQLEQGDSAADVVAIDDVSFGPACALADPNSSTNRRRAADGELQLEPSPPEVEASAAGEEQGASGSGWLAALCALLGVSLAVGYLANTGRLGRSARLSRAPATGAQGLALGPQRRLSLNSLDPARLFLADLNAGDAGSSGTPKPARRNEGA